MLNLNILKVKEHLSYWFSMLTICFGIVGSSLYAQKKDGSPNKNQSDLYLRAPAVVPGTLFEMRQPSYWISKMESPDAVVLNLKSIKSRNASYRQRTAHWSDLDSTLVKRIHKQIKDRPGLLAYIPDISSMTFVELSNFTERMIQSDLDYLRSREFGNIMAIGYSDEELAEIQNEISYNHSNLKIPIQTGITTNQSRLRIIPPVKPEYVGLFTNGKARWDLWNLDVLPIGTSVQILQTSRTAAFLFVLSDRGYGWVPSEDIAIGSTPEINRFENANNFVVCTGDRIPFYVNSKCKSVLGWLRMGDRLPLFGVDTRSIKVSVRNANGKFSVQEAWLKSDADVHVGYLPYTRKNVALQAFKLLDNLYDWTGAWYGRNHVTNLRDIFSCFGFQLPANGILLSVFEEHPKKVEPDEGKEAQFKAISANEPFLTLQICENGHSQMYMGNYNGMPIGFDAHGYGYKNRDGNEMELKRWVVGNIEIPDYFLKQEITFVRLY